MNSSPNSRRARVRLLASIPALLLVLPASAFAQSTTVTVDGRTAVTNDQRSDHATIRGALGTATTTINVAMLSDAEAKLAGNTASARATANDADTALASDPLGGPAWPARISLAGTMVTADSGALAVSRQAMRGSTAIAETLGSGFQLQVGSTDTSSAVLADNVQRAAALGNNHLASLTDNGGTGAAIVAVQSGDTTSTAWSRLGGVSALLAGDVAASVLRTDRNGQSAITGGNSAVLTLRASSPAQVAGEDANATTVGTPRDADVSAGNAIVAAQYWEGATKAQLGLDDNPAGFLSIAATLSESASTVDSNTLGAAVVANQAVSEQQSDALLVQGNRTIATNLVFQDMRGPVSADAVGGLDSNVLGAVDRSTISVSDNQAMASATGNDSDTLLTGHAGHGFGSSESGPRAAAVWISPENVSGTTGSYTLHTEQRASASVTSLVDATPYIGLLGPVDGSKIVANGNRLAAQAVANDATSLLTLDAADFAGTAAAGLFQSNDGNIISQAGTPDHVVGATIAPLAALRGSQVEIRDNRVETQSVGNRGTNTLTLSAAELSPSGNIVGRELWSASRVGTLDQGFGASASTVLSSVQKTGQLGVAPSITSDISARFLITGDGSVSDARLDVTGNGVAARSTANTIDNALTLSAAGLEGGGAALFSSQYGEADVRATSTARFVSHGALVDSASSISGNSNIAVATMNDAASRLLVDGAEAGFGGPALLSADSLGGATGEADNLLVSTQFATGSVTAGAKSRLAGSPGASLDASGPSGSRFEIASNVTAAQATGNQALNDAKFQGSVTGGVANSQMSLATIAAEARSGTFMRVPQPGRTILNSSLTFSDNETSALARGNVAENSLSFESVSLASMPASTRIDRFDAEVEAPIALVSSQTSYGSITASAMSVTDVPLNHNGVPVEGSRISVSGNSLSATAYGNGVSNTVSPAAIGFPGVALANAQSNYGPVTAQVVTGTVNLMPGDVTRSSLGIVDNRVSATAIGNLATNVIGIVR